MKKVCIFIIVFLFPIYVFAYSNEIIVGGETIGIEVHSDGVYVVGFYPVLGENIAYNAGFEKGDIIIEIDNNKINRIFDLNKVLQEEKEYNFIVLRNNSRITIPLVLKEENFLLKTGLYVKDQINGIGTLSYIDPVTKVYGSLGHEILESVTLNRFKIKDGSIYKAEVSSIKKTEKGLTGSKNADIFKMEEDGKIYSNNSEGIFGIYTSDFPNNKLIKVGEKHEIKKGKAILRTVIDKGKIEDFSISILAIDESSSNKNILFEITDDKLLEKTGGIVQGMSGSPILQNDKIIGVVNYVIVEDGTKGYGIFITTMLEKGDEILK